MVILGNQLLEPTNPKENRCQGLSELKNPDSLGLRMTT